MAIPIFLKKAKEAGVSAPSEPIVRKPDEPQDYDMLESAAEDLMSAIEAKDSKGIASALKAAFEIISSESTMDGE